MGMVSCCRPLGVRSFVLKVRSWSANDVPVNLYQMNVFSVLTRKGKVPRHNFYPPRSQSWLRGGRSQLAPSGPGSHALPSCHPWGSQSSNPSGPQSPQAVQMGRPGLTDCDSWQPLLVGHRDRDGGAVPCFSSPGPWLVEGLSEGSGALQEAVPSLLPGPSSSSAGPRLGKLEGLQEKVCICLLPYSLPDDPHTMDPWLDHFPSGPSLTVTSGQGPVQRWPIA